MKRCPHCRKSLTKKRRARAYSFSVSAATFAKLKAVSEATGESLRSMVGRFVEEMCVDVPPHRFVVGDEQFARLADAIENPRAPNEALVKLFRSKP